MTHGEAINRFGKLVLNDSGRLRTESGDCPVCVLCHAVTGVRYANSEAYQAAVHMGLDDPWMMINALDNEVNCDLYTRNRLVGLTIDPASLTWTPGDLSTGYITITGTP